MFLSDHFLFWEILNLSLQFAINMPLLLSNVTKLMLWRINAEPVLLLFFFLESFDADNPGTL